MTPRFHHGVSGVWTALFCESMHTVYPCRGARRAASLRANNHRCRRIVLEIEIVKYVVDIINLAAYFGFASITWR